jgi:hypothetical protein
VQNGGSRRRSDQQSSPDFFEHLDSQDADGGCELLALSGAGVDLVDDAHASDDAAEDGETLAVRVAFAAEIQLRLVAHADRWLR